MESPQRRSCDASRIAPSGQVLLCHGVHRVPQQVSEVSLKKLAKTSQRAAIHVLLPALEIVGSTMTYAPSAMVLSSGYPALCI
eukprot:712309-Rhodomonas_salina.2